MKRPSLILAFGKAGKDLTKDSIFDTLRFYERVVEVESENPNVQLEVLKARTAPRYSRLRSSRITRSEPKAMNRYPRSK